MESASPHSTLGMLEGQAGRRTLKSSKTAVLKLRDCKTTAIISLPLTVVYDSMISLAKYSSIFILIHVALLPFNPITSRFMPIRLTLFAWWQRWDTLVI